jgi:hypothetical protein
MSCPINATHLLEILIHNPNQDDINLKIVLETCISQLRHWNPIMIDQLRITTSVRMNWFYFDLIFWCFNATFSYIMATSISGGRSRSTRRELPKMGKQLVNFITCGCELSSPFFVIYKTGHEPMPYWW